MPVREIVAKTTAFGVVALALIAGGLFVFWGPHAYNDYTNTATGLILVAMGLLTGGVGTLIIAGVIRDARVRQREARLHLTPRLGPPAPPPAWGMGNIGVPGSGVVTVGDGLHGGGAAKIVSLKISNVDVPLGIGYLLVWTTVGLIAPVWLWALGAATLLVAGPFVLASKLRRR